MCGILHPGCRFALPWAKCLLLFQGVYFAGLSSRTGVYSCLSPCDGCKTRKGDGGAGGKYPSLLEDFQTGTASMARKRHLASPARGFLCLCLMAQIEVQEVQRVQGVQGVQGVQEVQWVQIRPIRLIRGGNSSRQPVLYGRGIAISISGEHLITGHHLLDLATVFALLKSKGGNKGKMHLLFGG